MQSCRSNSKSGSPSEKTGLWSNLKAEGRAGPLWWLRGPPGGSPGGRSSSASPGHAHPPPPPGTRTCAHGDSSNTRKTKWKLSFYLTSSQSHIGYCYHLSPSLSSLCVLCTLFFNSLAYASWGRVGKGTNYNDGAISKHGFLSVVYKVATLPVPKFESDACHLQMLQKMAKCNKIARCYMITSFWYSVGCAPTF
jgi:hypothetical protein